MGAFRPSLKHNYLKQALFCCPEILAQSQTGGVPFLKSAGLGHAGVINSEY